MSELDIPNPKRTRIKSKHSFRIRGSIFELRHVKAISRQVRRDVLYRRFFVSPEFVELFYKLHDGEFDQLLFDRLQDNEKQTMSTALTFLDINNREFNIALSKAMRSSFERFKLIEGAIKAGNLSTDLHDEYVNLMRMLSKLGMIPKSTASQNVNAIGRTLRSQQRVSNI